MDLETLVLVELVLLRAIIALPILALIWEHKEAK